MKNELDIAAKSANKFLKALDIFLSCEGVSGYWADPARYRHQCWTRDFVLSIMPILFKTNNQKMVFSHLSNLIKLQQPNGQIPILFLDNTWEFVLDKLKRSWKSRKVSFMLKRFLQGELWNLTPGTRDSEILFIIGMYEYAQAFDDSSFVHQHMDSIQKALYYIENNLMEDGLVLGCDWRDTMESELGQKPLLTNNSLLYHMYKLMKEDDKARDLRVRIMTTFHKDEKQFIDYPGNDRFDPLGGSLAVLHGVIDPSFYPEVFAGFCSVDSPNGVTIKCRHNPQNAEEAAIIEKTDGVVLWPFTQGFSIIALRKMSLLAETESERDQYSAMAKEQFRKMCDLDGFAEWYDPETGKGYGAAEQVWSAALYLRASCSESLQGQE